MYTYSANRGAQWGFGVNIEDEFVMRWTKLELQAQPRYLALETLANLLAEIQDMPPLGGSVEHNIPHHLIKAPSDVVTDYLTEVANAVRTDIRQITDEASLSLFPIDLIITRPNDWDPRAENLTFRATTKAFAKAFPEMGAAPRPAYIRLAAESEACAQYTLRDVEGLGEGAGIRDLHIGDCFIVVDAGGGTVVSHGMPGSLPRIAC